MDNHALRKELSKTIVHRITTFDLTGKTAEKVAKNMILGASNLALLQGDKELGQYLHSLFTDIVEFNYKLVYKWAELPVPAKVETGDKEAA